MVQKRGTVVVKREVTNIAILHHLSRLHFTSIAVHELCHAWLFYRNFDNLPLRVEEGMCVLLEYHYLKHVAERGAQPNSTLQQEATFLMQLIEENKDPIYGGGFRAARDTVNQYGLSNTLHTLKNKRYWPGTSPWRDDLKLIWRKLFR
jgi:hypothetical protein